MLTDNDWRVLRAIIHAIVQTGCRTARKSFSDSEASCTLSLRDIGDASGVHPISISRHVHRLEERGLLRRERSAGPSPTTYYMDLPTLGAAYVLLDATVGMVGPWPDRSAYKY